MSYSFVPPSKEINFGLNNFGQVYSTGSGDAKASILKKNLLVRAWSGYELTSGVEYSESDDFITNVKFVHSQLDGGVVKLDSDSYTGTVSSDILSPLYDSTTYDATTYSYPAYYHKKFTTSNDEISSRKISASVSSNKFELSWKRPSGSWQDWTVLNTGANEVDMTSDPTDDYVECAIRFKSNTWNTADYISTLGITTEDRVFLFKKGTFVLDEPTFNDTSVMCKGRDYLKKALETEINLPTYTSAKVGTVASDILDRCNVPYTLANWATLSDTITIDGTIAEQLNNITGWKALDYLMDVANGNDAEYRLKTEENGGLSIKKIPLDSIADYSIHYKYNIENVKKNYNAEKQLQRITVMNKNVTVKAEELLKSYAGTASTLHATYGSACLFVRYEDDNSAITSETARTNTAIDFAMSGTTADIKVYGCKPRNAITNEIWAEKGNSANMLNNDGTTYKKVNPFMTQALANSYAEYMIDLYADPKKEIELTMVSNPYLELQDDCVVFDRYTYSDDIYGLQSITENFNDPSLKDTLILADRGVDLAPFVWDRNGLTAGVNDLHYGYGFVWDQDLDVNATADNTDYSYLKKVKFS